MTEGQLNRDAAPASALPKLHAYCLPWHTQASPAFNDILVTPLRHLIHIELTSWPPSQNVDFSRPLIFCQIQPPPEILAEPRAKIVWLPMWDNARHFTPGWWATLPRKNLRIVALSEPVRRDAQRAGLSCLRARFHKDPADFPPTRWGGARTLFYWNRTGLAGREFLERLCQELHIERLIFRQATDPGFESQEYELPARLGAVEVVNLGKFAEKSAYDTLLREANFYLAPRLYEGVGLTVLEAMCSSCAVLAHDAPTMNEYITHRRNGWLFPSIRPPLWRERLHTSLHRRWPRLTPPVGGAMSLGLKQDWCTLRETDWAALGRAAREDQSTGHRTWLAQLPELARFILEW
ncbi:MAG TPA: glycosyltransferase [Opitutaceae bacterium]|jgi:hypothetical protein|nr:glycosyltransferase [Opitutaceae bacterium]